MAPKSIGTWHILQQFNKKMLEKSETFCSPLQNSVFWNHRLVQNTVKKNKKKVAKPHLKFGSPELWVLQVNLFQKLATSAEHVVYQNCSECQNKTKATLCVHNIFFRYSELTIFIKNEQSVAILWVSWCKNKSFWQRYTSTLSRFLKILSKKYLRPISLYVSTSKQSGKIWLFCWSFLKID